MVRGFKYLAIYGLASFLSLSSYSAEKDASNLYSREILAKTSDSSEKKQEDSQKQVKLTGVTAAPAMMAENQREDPIKNLTKEIRKTVFLTSEDYREQEARRNADRGKLLDYLEHPDTKWVPNFAKGIIHGGRELVRGVEKKVTEALPENFYFTTDSKEDNAISFAIGYRF